MVPLAGSVATVSGATEVGTHAVANDYLRVAEVVASIVGAERSDLLFLVLVLLPPLLRRRGRRVCRSCSQVVDCDP